MIMAGQKRTHACSGLYVGTTSAAASPAICKGLTAIHWYFSFLATQAGTLSTIQLWHSVLPMVVTSCSCPKSCSNPARALAALSVTSG